LNRNRQREVSQGHAGEIWGNPDDTRRSGLGNSVRKYWERQGKYEKILGKYKGNIGKSDGDSGWGIEEKS
jgi:hypothetical protein